MAARLGSLRVLFLVVHVIRCMYSVRILNFAGVVQEVGEGLHEGCVADFNF